MKLVNLASGGIDSTLVSILAREQGFEVFPLFIDYGQRAAQREWEACCRVHEELGFRPPTKFPVAAFGSLIETGLTCGRMDLVANAFTPCRNLLLLVLGAAWGYGLGARHVAVGLLAERVAIFPDQTNLFLEHATLAIRTALGADIRLVAPLADFTKAETLRLAAARAVRGTYSCHTGEAEPCGVCISCCEIRDSTSIGGE